MVASENIISILIAAKNEASAVLARVAADTKAVSAETNGLSNVETKLASSSSNAGSLLNDMASGAAAVGAEASHATPAINEAEKGAKALSAATKEASAASVDGSKVMREFGGNAGYAAAFLDGPAGLATAVAVAATAIGVTAVKAAGDFQQSLTKLTTSAGETQANLKMVGDGILNLAVQTGTSTTQLADAMYKVESGGQHGAAGLEVLRAAAQGAKAEQSDLTTVADAVTSAMADYGIRADGAATLTSKLVAATAAGKMTFQELAGALPQILPVASAAHVSLNDILGDMASMTVHGMSAEQSAQNLSNTIEKMLTPTAQQAKELALLGLTTNQLGDDLKSKGLSGTLQEITDRIAKMVPAGQNRVILDLKNALSGLPPAVQELGAKLFDGSMSMKEYNKAASALDPISAKQALSFATLAGSMHRIGDQQMSGVDVMQNYSQALYKATGDSTALRVALMLTGDNTNTTTNAIKSITNATADAAGNVKGWSDIQKNFNQQIAVFGQLVNTNLIRLGTFLLSIWDAASRYLAPALSMVGDAWNKYLMPLFNWIAGDNGKQIVQFFGVGLAVTIGLVAAPILAVSAATMILIAIWERLIGVIVDVVAWLGKEIPAAVNTVIAWWDNLGKSTESTWANFTGSISSAVYGIWSGITGGLASLGSNILGWASGVVDGVVGWFQQLPKRIGDAISGAVGSAGKSIGDVLHAAHIPGFASGTNYAPGGLAVVGEQGPELVNLPQGSQVIPAHQTRSMLGGRGASVNITGGVHLYNNMDVQKFYKELGWKVSLA